MKLIDTFLISTYDSPLEKVLGCVDTYLEAFYRVFLNNHYDCVDFGDEYLYFSIRKSQYEYNLLGHIFYTNKSLNQMYKNLSSINPNQINKFAFCNI
jgi:hypothetical protein